LDPVKEQNLKKRRAEYMEKKKTRPVPLVGGKKKSFAGTSVGKMVGRRGA